MSERGPYAASAWAYRHAGWVGVLPLPPRAKKPPPAGYTGHAAIAPSGADVQAWIDGPEGAGNVALHLADGLFGLDVDNYGGKHGASSLAELVERCGSLPATWTSTSRDDGVSGIRVFRAALPSGRVWLDRPARGVESVHRGHRYAVVGPSVHPDTGRAYGWLAPDGNRAERPPGADELAELPAAWVAALSKPGEYHTGHAATYEQTRAALEGFRQGEVCPPVDRALREALAALQAPGAELHPTATGSVWSLVRLGYEGHADVRAALIQHCAVFLGARERRGEGRDGALAEWQRMAAGAVGKLDGPARAGCDCALRAGEGVQFEYERGPASTVEPLAATEPPAADAAPVEVSAEDRLIAEMLDTDALDSIGDLEPLVKGVLSLDTVARVNGKSGHGKSFLVLDMAGHIGAGRPWHGHAVRQGLVVYLVAEGAKGIRKRVRAWEKHHGVKMANVLFLPRPINANSPEWDTLGRAVRRLRPVLVVADTQARITVGMEENSNSEMTLLHARCDDIRRATGACFLLVHHFGHNGEEGRGATSIKAALQTELSVERKGQAVTLACPKQKDDDDTWVMRFTMQVVDLGVDADGDPVTSLVLAPVLFDAPGALADWIENAPKNQSKIMTVVADHFAEAGGTKPEVRATLAERYGEMPRTSFNRAWDSLLGKGILVRVQSTQRHVLASLHQSTNPYE